MHTQKRWKCHENSKRSVILCVCDHFDFVSFFARLHRIRAERLSNDEITHYNNETSEKKTKAQTIPIIFLLLSRQFSLADVWCTDPRSSLEQNHLFRVSRKKFHRLVILFRFIGNFMQKSIKTFFQHFKWLFFLCMLKTETDIKTMSRRL